MQFDPKEAKEFLQARAEKEKQQEEEARQLLLQQTLPVLQKYFSGSEVEVYIVGSLIRPYHFHSASDIDIVLKNFTGDRFQVWTELEGLLHRNVEIILFESCHFQDFVTTQGLKVI